MVTKTETPPAALPASNQEQRPATESLDDLARDSVELDQPKPVQVTKADQAALASEAEEVETALKLLRASTVPFAPGHVQDALGAVWSDSQLHEIAEAIVHCAKASGITVSSWFGKHGHWIRLGFALGVPSLATLKILRTPAPPQQVQHGQHAPS